MSRSRKKMPIGPVAGCSRGTMKKWKKQCNRSIRRIPIEADLGNGSFVHRLSEVWMSPSDGKTFYHEAYHTKAMRK